MSNLSNAGNVFSWINPKLKLSQSTIQGAGYVAQEPIKKDEKLIVQSGQCLDISKIDDDKMESCWYYGFQIEHDVYYYPLYIQDVPFLDGIFRINHSCDPNAGFRGQITLVAMRDIEIGEEITYDYAMTDIETDMEAAWEPESCTCGAETCRGKITGHDWKHTDVQKKYEGYFSTHVANSIKQLNESDKL